MTRTHQNQLVRVEIANFSFRTGNANTLENFIFEHIDNTGAGLLALSHYNLHGLYLAFNNPHFADYLHKTNISWIDGQPIVILLKVLGYRVGSNWRSTFLDWQFSFFNRANDEKISIFLLGSKQQTIQNAELKLADNYPEIVFNSHHGYFYRDENPMSTRNRDVVQLINKIKPDILLVGMSMPLQEKWILQNSEQLSTKVIMPVGGYFDYLGGLTHTPNRRISKFGLEWLLRLISEPKRLWKRYLIEPWFVLAKLLSFYISRRK